MKKLLSILTSIAVILAMMPSMAFAETQSESDSSSSGNECTHEASITAEGVITHYDTLDDALANAESKTIKLLSNITYSSAKCFDIDKQVTIDLNGKTITAVSNGSCSNGGATHFIRVKNGGDLTITDTSASKEGCITATYGANSLLLVVEVMSGGKFIFEAGKIENDVSTNYGSSTVYIRDGGTFILDGGTVAAVKPTANKRAYAVWNCGVMKMEKGSITSTDSSTAGVTQESTQPLEIKGGNITTAYKTSISVSRNKAIPVISGGKFSGAIDTKWVAEGKYGVYDGTKTVVSGSAPEAYNACINQNVYYTGENGANEAWKVIDTGNTIVLRATPIESTSKSFSSGVITVKLENSATFDPDLIKLANGYKVITTSSDTDTNTTEYSVVVDETTAQARIGDTYYTTLGNANVNAKNGDTITVLDDITGLTSPISISKEITIDLNGHMIQGKKNNLSYSPYGAIVKTYVDGAKLTIVDSSAGKNGKIENTGTSGYGVAAEKGTVIIKAGEYTGTTAAVFAGENGAISVVGGTFSSNPTSYVASGYEVTGNGPFTVSRIYVPSAPVEKDPVTNEGTSGSDNATTNADITDKVTTSEGKAEAVVDPSTGDKIVSKAEENKSSEVVIEAGTAAGKAETTSVALPETTVKAIAEKTDASVTINTDNGSVTLDKEAVDAVAAQAGTAGVVTLVVETVESTEEKVVVELKLQTSNGYVTDFNGGNVSVTVPVNNQLKDKEVVCVYIDDEGIYHEVSGKMNADGTYTFVTGHFSTYAVMAKEDADKVITDQTAKIKATTIKLKSTKGRGYVKLTWTKSGKYDLDGYDVYRGKARTSLKRWGGTAKTAYRNAKSLKKGTTYYYKIRGYKIVDGKKIYTKWSNINYRKAI